MRHRDGGGVGGRLDRVLAAVGVLALVAATVTRPADTGAAISQDWSPFVLVTGLLLIGLVADDDGLFAAVGHQMARAAPNGTILFLGATVVIGAVTAVLNLNTSVAFLTPVLVYTARSRGEDEAALLYGCLLLSNAGSLFLPGSNLTNLIVLGHLHLSGRAFLARMWAPALAALVVTAVVVAVFEHRSFRVTTAGLKRPERPVLGPGSSDRRARHRARRGLVFPGFARGCRRRGCSGDPPRPQKGPSPPCRPRARTPSLFARRAEPRAEPVRERLTGLVVMVANGSIGSGRAVACQSQPHRCCRGAAVDGRRSYLARRHRLKLTASSSLGRGMHYGIGGPCISVTAPYFSGGPAIRHTAPTHLEQPGRLRAVRSVRASRGTKKWFV